MKSPIAHVLVLGLGLAAAGCSATKDEVTKQLDEVRREMTALRASNAVLKDRLDLLETRPKVEPVGGEDGQAAESGDRPMLEVVHLSPEEEPGPAQEPVVAAPIDDSPPMVIVGDDQGVGEVDDEPAGAKAPKPSLTKPSMTKPPMVKPPTPGLGQSSKRGR